MKFRDLRNKIKIVKKYTKCIILGFQFCVNGRNVQKTQQ